MVDDPRIEPMELARPPIYALERANSEYSAGRKTIEVIPTRVKADPFQGFQNGASSESCPSASATGPMHDAQCGLVSLVLAAVEDPITFFQFEQLSDRTARLTGQGFEADVYGLSKCRYQLRNRSRRSAVVQIKFDNLSNEYNYNGSFLMIYGSSPVLCSGGAAAFGNDLQGCENRFHVTTGQAGMMRVLR